MKSEKGKAPIPSSKSSAKGETPPAKPSPTKALADGGYTLQVAYCDKENNRFLCLGGATFATKAECEAALRLIPYIIQILGGTVSDAAISPPQSSAVLGDGLDKASTPGKSVEKGDETTSFTGEKHEI